ncbi:hypothetical protein Tco_1379953, partial [Tanacetum coccineum]
KEPVAFQAPKTTSQTEKMDPKGTKPGAKTGRRKSTPLTMNNPLSKLKKTKSGPLPKEVTETQTGHSKKRKLSGTAKDKNPSQPSASTPMVVELHKEAQQATSGPASLGVTSIVRANSQLSSTNPSVLVDKTQFAGDGLGIVRTGTRTKKEASNEQEFYTSPEFTTIYDEVNKEIKLEDLSGLVKNIGTEVIDLDSPEDNQPFMVPSDEEEEINAEPHAKTKDTSVPTPSSLKSIKIQELSIQVLLLQSQNIKLKKEKVAAESETTFLSAQRSFPNVQQITELLVAALENINLDLPAGLLALPEQFATAIESASQKAGDICVPSAGQASTHPAEGEKYTNQATITQLFQRRIEKDVAKANLNKEPTITKTTTIIPLITTTTTALIIPTPLSFQSPFTSSRPNTTPQHEGEQVRDKCKKDVSHEEVVKEEFESDSDAEIGLLEEIKNQMDIENTIKVDAAKSEIKKVKQYLIDLVGLKVVERIYWDKVKYDKYCLKMLNQRALGKITNYDVLLRGKGPITLKVYRDDGSEKIIQNFKASDLHLREWREVMQCCSQLTFNDRIP